MGTACIITFYVLILHVQQLRLKQGRSSRAACMVVWVIHCTRALDKGVTGEGGGSEI